MIQHLRVLTESGLVSTEKSGRVRICRIRPDALRLAEDWIGRRRTDWELSLDRLGDVLAEPDNTVLEGPHD
ncbi:ArsR/SmtB family transcription factor [Actinokineospora sp. 24-640]